MNTGHSYDNRRMRGPADSGPADRLKSAATKYYNALWATNASASNKNCALRQWQDVAAVHSLIHPGCIGGPKCPGPMEEAMPVEKPWWDSAFTWDAVSTM